MTPDQRQLVIDAGFGGLLKCSCSQLQPNLCNWLLESFRAGTCELVFPSRGKIPITEATVHRVMGILRGNHHINYDIDVDTSTFMLDQFGITNGKHPKVSDQGKILKNNKIADMKYLRIWTIFASCSVITPTFSTKVSPRCYPAVIDATQISQQNWCRLVIQILKKSAQSGSNKPIMYIDSLQTGFIRLSSTGSRVSVWSTKLVKKVIQMDTKNDGTFGALQLKYEFDTKDDSVFGSALHLDNFVTQILPPHLGTQERLKAKRPVENMCNGFSGLVTKFLRDIYEPDTEDNDGKEDDDIQQSDSTRDEEEGDEGT